MSYLLVVLGVVALIALSLVYASFSWGFVLYKFYGWFLLPVFTDLPVVDYWQAVGLMFIVMLFKNTDSGIRDEYKNEHHHYYVFLAPWISFVFGWFIYTIFIS